MEAPFDIALDHGLITKPEYDLYETKSESLNKLSEDIQKEREKRAKKLLASEKRANPALVAEAYNLIKEKSPLSDKHREKLRKERFLSEERIEKNYFTMPETAYKKNIITKTLMDRCPDTPIEELAIIPGFFLNKKSGKLAMASQKGLGILIRNADGVPIGIQIRHDVIKEGESRYTWFSSVFAMHDDKYAGGASCGSPKDVEFPEVAKNTLCITEGKFKSEKLAANGNTSISIQGVTAWKGICSTISDIKKKQKADNIFFFFDADMWGKKAIFEQSKNLCSEIKKTFPAVTIKYAVWAISDGKGVDDCINNGNLSKIKFLDPKKVSDIEEGVYNSILKYYGISGIRELP